MGPSIWQILLLLAVILIIFGARRLPNIMSDVGKGIRGFKDGLDGNKIEKKPSDKEES